jgi:MoaA/NifB/PqqE/SkfB family radical SAM enzyme
MSLELGDWIVNLSESSSPQELVLEVSTRCNLQCIHCFRYAAEKIKFSDMSFEDYKKIVDNAANSGVKRLVLTGWGEPTVNSHILDMLSYAKSKNLVVVLNTNGARLMEIAEDIVKIGVDELYVSVDAVDVELYEKIRKLGNLSAVSRGLEELFKAKKVVDSRKPAVKTIFTITKLNLDNILKLLDYAVEANILEVYLSFYIHYPSGAGWISCLEDVKCLNDLKSVLEKLAVKAINVPVRIWAPNMSSYTSRTCPFAANKALFVRVDGSVAPCIYMAYDWVTIVRGIRRRIRAHIIGDALRESLLTIWRRNSKMYFKLYFNNMPSCLDCELVNWCSYTLSSEVDCWGNRPNCSHCPYLYRFSYCPT